MKILIAGAGIAGSVLARMLLERDHTVTVLDARPYRAASRCAFAYLRTAWWTGEERKQVRSAVDWYEQRGWVITRQAEVHDLRRDRVVTQADHVLIDPHAPLLKPDIAMDLTRYSDGPGGVLVSAGDGVALDADALVLACGAGMDRWYSGTPTYGGIFEAPGRCMSGDLRLLRVTDRMTYTAAAGERITRVGASRARTPEAAKARAEAILKRMLDANIIDTPAPWTYRAGTRWSNLAGPGGGARISQSVWAFTGFARSGYATVPTAARDLVRELEK